MWLLNESFCMNLIFFKTFTDTKTRLTFTPLISYKASLSAQSKLGCFITPNKTVHGNTMLLTCSHLKRTINQDYMYGSKPIVSSLKSKNISVGFNSNKNCYRHFHGLLFVVYFGLMLKAPALKSSGLCM